MRDEMFFLLFAAFCSTSIAQTVRFQKNFGYIDYDYGVCVQKTSDSGYILAGNTETNYGSSLKKCYIVKTDSDGNKEWSKIIDYFPGYNVNYIHQTNDGGYIIGGRYQTYNPNIPIGLLIRLNEQGDTLWTKMYNNMNQPVFVQTLDEGFLAASRYLWNDTIVVVKTDTTGNVVWTKNYITDVFSVVDVIQTDDSCYVLNGFTGDWKNYLFKISVDGDSLWTKMIYASSPADDIYASDIKQTSDGGFVITGYGLYYDWDVIGTFILKTDSLGNELWAKHYGDYSHQSEGYSIDTAKDGGYFISGINITTRGTFLMRTDDSGDSLWTISFDAIDEDYQDEGVCVSSTKDGGCVIGGRKYMGALGKYDMYLIKIDTATTLPPPDTTGISYFETIENINILPNPSDGKFHLSLPLSFRDGTMEIYSVLGEKIYSSILTLTSTFFDLSSRPAGIYFLYVKNQQTTLVRKISVFH